MTWKQAHTTITFKMAWEHGQENKVHGSRCTEAKCMEASTCKCESGARRAPEEVPLPDPVGDLDGEVVPVGLPDAVKPVEGLGVGVTDLVGLTLGVADAHPPRGGTEYTTMEAMIWSTMARAGRHTVPPPLRGSR
jgi:hypothetical protein